MHTGFIAYPSDPPQIATEVRVAIESLKSDHNLTGFSGWEENDIAGRFLVTPILENIKRTDFLIADITRLNFNVAFEVGLARSVSPRFI